MKKLFLLVFCCMVMSMSLFASITGKPLNTVRDPMNRDLGANGYGIRDLDYISVDVLLCSGTITLGDSLTITYGISTATGVFSGAVNIVGQLTVGTITVPSGYAELYIGTQVYIVQIRFPDGTVQTSSPPASSWVGTATSDLIMNAYKITDTSDFIIEPSNDLIIYKSGQNCRFKIHDDENVLNVQIYASGADSIFSGGTSTAGDLILNAGSGNIKFNSGKSLIEAGHITPYGTTQDLGSAALPWDVLYADEIILYDVQQIGTNDATPVVFITSAIFHGNIGIGLTPTANMSGLSIENGYVTIKETTTPTADTNYGKIYPKNDDKLYFQDGTGNEHTIDMGATGIKHEFHMPFEDPTNQVGFWDVVVINNAQETHFAFQVSEDFESLVNAKIIMIPDASETIQWDINVSVAAAGELYDNDDRTALDQTYAVTASSMTEVDISGQLSGLAAGDYVAVDFQSDTNDLRIIGFEFDYE